MEFCPFYYSSPVRQRLVGLGLLIAEVSKSHSDTPHTVGLLWTSDQPVEKAYVTTYNTQKKQASMSLAGFEPAFPAIERQQAHVLDLAVTGICSLFIIYS